jgi:uncharacterized protein with HEPN domain
MRLEARKHLLDMQIAADRVARFSAAKSFDDYLADEMLRSAVERQFEIIGEALARLAKDDPGVAAAIPDYAKIIGFRNVLIRGYATVDDRIVWGVIENHLAPLRAAVQGPMSAP